MLCSCPIQTNSTGLLSNHPHQIQHQRKKRFSKLVEEKREEVNERFGAASECPDVTELVENFCCMHLGVNLRKSFFESEDSGSDDASSDVFVHTFCKLQSKTGGKHEIPEYGHGATAFPDFLTLMASQSKPSDATYYQQCGKMKLAVDTS